MNMILKPKVKVSWKIFSIAATLLLLLIIISSVSVLMVGNVKDEMKVVTTRYLGIERLVSAIDANVRQQAVHLERVLRLYRSRSSDTLESEAQAFIEGNEAVDRQFILAERLLKQVQKNNDSEAKEIAGLQKQVNKLKQDYTDLYNQQYKLMESLVNGKTVKPKLLRSITNMTISIEESVSTLRQEIETFVEGATGRVESKEKQVLYTSIALTVIAVLIGIIASVLVIQGIVKPVHSLLQGTREVEKGNLQGHLEVTTHDEIGQLTSSFNKMVEELRLKEQIKSVFGKYVDPRIVNTLIEDEQKGLNHGEHREMTVFFSDIANFTSIGEKLDPDTLVKLINAYLTEMSVPIKENLGVIDKFIGDAIMAFWGDPFTPGGRHPLQACNAALWQMQSLEEFRKSIPELIGSGTIGGPFDIRIGIATGEVLIGSIGSEDSKGYTVMGDTVNLASRLEGINKEYGSHVMISERTYELANKSLEVREMDTIRVKGKLEPVKIYELICLKGEMKDDDKKWRDTFEAGLLAYRQMKFDLAAESFQDVLKLRDDKPSRVFLKRIEYFRTNKPPADWDGVWTFTTK